jgi:hypothetical protein
MIKHSLTLLTLAGCGGGLDLPTDTPFPQLLSEIDPERAIDALPYAPAWPLWSNGLAKQRWVYVPKGTSVDTRTEDWTFPVGSVLFKTFSDGQTPVETRAMRLLDDGWEYGIYVWDGDDAVLTDGLTPIEIEGLDHTVPNTLDCRTCHEPGGGVIGLRDLQLRQADLDTLAPILMQDPHPRGLPEADALTADVLGYFVGNCTPCHDGDGGEQHSFDLDPEVALDNTIDVPTDPDATQAGTRVLPGSPQDSLLWLAFSGQHESQEIKAMPPLGVQLRDQAAVGMLKEWIEQL